MKSFVKPDVKSIANHLNISPSYVCLILAGKRKPKKYTKKVFELAGSKQAA